MARREDDSDAVKLPRNDDVSRAIALLEWGRRRGFLIGPTVQVGDVIMQVQDLRQAKQEGLAERTVDDGTVYTEAGLKEEDVPVPGTVG